MREFGLPIDLYRQLKQNRSSKQDVARVFNALVKEPFNVPFDDLGKLTPVVVRHIYFRPEEEKTGSLPLPKETHARQCAAAGLSLEETERRWQEQVRQDPGLAALYGG